MPGGSSIDTGRLVLRPWHPQDQVHLNTILGDPSVMEFSDRGVLGDAAQAAWLERAVSASVKDGLFGCRAIERKQDGRVIGYISLTSDPSRVKSGDAEIGFRLARHAWNKGYATEAARSLMEAARACRCTERVVAIVDPNNTRSLRVIAKLGMSRIAEFMLDGYEYPDDVYAREIVRHPQPGRRCIPQA